MNERENAIIASYFKSKNESTLACCSNPDIKNINGLYTCTNCGVVQGPQIVYGWIDYKPYNVARFKSVYNRTYYVKQKLLDLQTSLNDIETIMKIWSFVETHLKTVTNKRFPKLDFFIHKILEWLEMPQRPKYKISSAMKLKYETIWKTILTKIA